MANAESGEEVGKPFGICRKSKLECFPERQLLTQRHCRRREDLLSGRMMVVGVVVMLLAATTAFMNFLLSNSSNKRLHVCGYVWLHNMLTRIHTNAPTEEICHLHRFLTFGSLYAQQYAIIWTFISVGSCKCIGVCAYFCMPSTCISTFVGCHRCSSYNYMPVHI